MKCSKNGPSTKQIFGLFIQLKPWAEYIGDLDTQAHQCLPTVPKLAKEDTIPNRCLQIGAL